MTFKATFTRLYSLSKFNSNPPPFPLLNRLLLKPSPISPQSTPFSNSSQSPNQRNPKLVNFSLPSDSESDSDSQLQEKPPNPKNLPPPYNPLDEKPQSDSPPTDPTNLAEVFTKLREDGLMNSAAKMFDGLSSDGLTHEALELFTQIKNKGEMPEVIAHTAVMEAYEDAGQAKEAHKVYLRMLRCGVLPNAYTYGVIVKALVGNGDKKMVEEGRKYVGEMVGRGMRPNAETVVAVVEGMVKVGMEEEGRMMVKGLKEKGVVVVEEVRRLVEGKGGLDGVVLDVLFGN